MSSVCKFEKWEELALDYLIANKRKIIKLNTWDDKLGSLFLTNIFNNVPRDRRLYFDGITTIEFSPLNDYIPYDIPDYFGRINHYRFYVDESNYKNLFPRYKEIDPTINQKHKCCCKLSSLLRNGCKCGGI